MRASCPMGRFAVTTDALVEGVDFELAWAPPQAVGYKALAANLSDLAAMGARAQAPPADSGMAPQAGGRLRGGVSSRRACPRRGGGRGALRG